MKNIVLLVCVAMLCMFSIASSQTFMDYVSAMRGDTAVIKDYADMSNVASSLTNALNADTPSASVPAGRVYMLKKAGYYPLGANPSTDPNRTVVIVGEDSRRLVKNTDATSYPPIICGFNTNPAGMTNGKGLVVKNCALIESNPDGSSLGWAYFGNGAPNTKLWLENDLFEHTRWVFVQSNGQEGSSTFINDCYFVNMIGEPCRRNGGVFDNVDRNTDTIWVENSTHIMAQGSIYKFRNFQIKKLFFNHNTFVDCAGSIFESLGYVSDLTVTNNIFVNSNVQSFSDSLGVWDAGETDADMLPTGLINCDTLPADYTQMDRKMLVDRNVVYWDSRFNDMESTLITAVAAGTSNWVSQRIKMNSRTIALFADNTNYPLLNEGVWYEKCPTFTKPENLLTGEVDSIKAFALATVNSTRSASNPARLGVWRLVNTGGADDFVYSDWPIPVDLSYTDADLLVGGTKDFPVGDLNWFPAKKAEWVAQKADEHAVLQYMLDHGVLTAVDQIDNRPASFTLGQNYPNPFNPTTKISFTLPHSANASLKVYDILGREVATLLNGFATAGTHEVQFDATNFASGVYFYELASGNFSQMKKMVLVK